MVKTKIIATFGPATDDDTVVRKMISYGLDMARLNFSHGDHASHIRHIQRIRRLNKKMRRSIKIIADLEGYRIRVGKLPQHLLLKKNTSLYLVPQEYSQDSREIPFDYRGPLTRIKKGTMIYIDDGRIVLSVKGVRNKRLAVRVVVGGLLKEHKGINIPGVKLEFPSLTQKDKRDLKVAINYKADYVAQSFVRNARDIDALRKELIGKHPDCPIFAKIESREGLENIDEIIAESDGIIIARGDMGICLPIHKVPIIQKELIKKCRLAQKPVVVATQMLESMITQRIPTRAEVSDVANAILDGADYLLVSGETTIGKHPHRVIEMMNKIIKHTEQYQKAQENFFE